MDNLRQLISQRHSIRKICYFNDVISKCNSFKQSMKTLQQMRQDSSMFIVIERQSKIRFNKFATEIIGVDRLAGERLNDYQFIIISGQRVSISTNNREELRFILKQVFKNYECELCSKRFSELGTKKRHLLYCHKYVATNV